MERVTDFRFLENLTPEALRILCEALAMDQIPLCIRGKAKTGKTTILMAGLALEIYRLAWISRAATSPCTILFCSPHCSLSGVAQVLCRETGIHVNRDGSIDIHGQPSKCHLLIHRDTSRALEFVGMDIHSIFSDDGEVPQLLLERWQSRGSVGRCWSTEQLPSWHGHNLQVVL